MIISSKIILIFCALYLSAASAKENTSLSTYIQASIPARIFQCLTKQTFVRCIKLFLLQRVENISSFPNTGNLTKDFLDQFVYNDEKFPSLSNVKYLRISDKELTQKLIRNLRVFFKGRKIKVHFLPEISVQIVPNTKNKINISLKKDQNEFRAQKTYRKMLQIAVPVMIMPVILLGSFLPFMIPAIKMAAIMSTLLNNGALLAAIIYAARTVAQNNEQQPIHYSYPGYH